MQNSFISRNYTRLIFAVFLINLVLLLYANWSGIGLTYDSYDYWDAANNLKLFLSRQSIGDRVIPRPPFFPILLSLCWGLASAKWVIIILFTVSNYVFVQILNSCMKIPVYKLGAFMLFSLAVPVHLIHSFLWTESLIMLILLIQAYLLIRENTTEVSCFTFLLVLGMIAVLTKNGYLLAVPGLALSIVLKFTNPKGIGFALFFSLVLFVVHFFSTSTFLSLQPVNQVVKISALTGNYLNVISAWFLPLTVPFGVRIAVLSLGFILIGYLYINKQLFKNINLNIVGSLFIFYFLFRSYYAHIDYHESERYLSVAYPLFVIAVFLILEKGLDNIANYWVNVSRKIGCTVVCLWMVYSIIRVIKNDVFWHAVRNLN